MPIVNITKISKCKTQRNDVLYMYIILMFDIVKQCRIPGNRLYTHEQIDNNKL